MIAHPESDAILEELVAIAGTGNYPELYQFFSLAGAWQFKRLYALFRRFVSPPANVLDWGAGNGHFSYFLVKSGYDTTAFTISPETYAGIVPAGSYRLVEGSMADPFSLPFPDRSFDAVTSVGVLEHVRETGGDELASLREIRRVLKPGGYFICDQFPNRYSYIEFLARKFPGKTSHPYRYTAGDVRRLAGEAQLELIEWGRYAILPRNTLHYLPFGIGNRHWFARFWSGLDRFLTPVFSPIGQCYFFVARVPSDAG